MIALALVLSLAGAAPFSLDQCVSAGRAPGDCEFVALTVAACEQTELQELIALARAREEREEEEAAREGWVTGGVWGFVNFSYRISQETGGRRLYAWLHVTDDAAWIDGDEGIGVTFTPEESKRLGEILARIREPEREQPARTSVTPADLVAALPPHVAWRDIDPVDLNCDLVDDHVFVASDDTHYYVAAVVSPLHDDATVRFVRLRLGGGAQDALCGPDVEVESESRDDDVTAMLGHTPAGWSRSKHCRGLRVTSGDCDAFHIYWNVDRQTLDWWRL